ncbi:acyl-CoA dehydrogenase [bacterium]|nr:acyl-CoA dehydrogenase [bacterium]
MPHYHAPLADFHYLYTHVLGLDCWNEVPGLESVKELAGPVLDEAAKLCEQVLYPLHQSADREGLKLVDGAVITPKGFKEAYKAYIVGGWPSLACDPDYGGQGLPETLNMAVVEMICSANLAFGLTPGLTHAAYNALIAHGSDELKQAYLPKMVDGTWSGVMCLTEPQAGTDLGLIRTKAEPDGDQYKISGTKIFISSGEQDLTDNIIHLVLARLPGAPEGIKGISLFLVPKILPDGTRNAVHCRGLEHKMGLHASPTCVMEYENAVGYLIGTPHKGVRQMFTMMNAARLYVGVQGLGVAELATQNALTYARERVQGATLGKDSHQATIIEHPDVRRMLLTMKSMTEGMRALCLESALHLDISHRHPLPEVRQAADEWIQLMTPVIKALFTDMGHELANVGMQVFGGYGYIAEYGMEQMARDVRITQIYEGTNGVQALDLVGRKLSAENGRYLRRVFHPMTHFIEENLAHPKLGRLIKQLSKHVSYTQQATLWLAQNGLGNPNAAACGATEYNRMMGLTYVGYLWARMAVASVNAMIGGDEDPIHAQKIATAEFYMAKTLPQVAGLIGSIVAGDRSVMGKDVDALA